MAKHGVIGLTRALGIEYAPNNVRVNAIAPGYIETQLTLDWWDAQADPKAARQATLDLQPMKRIGQPQEVAMTAVFLASDEAPFVNASCITVDGDARRSTTIERRGRRCRGNSHAVSGQQGKQQEGSTTTNHRHRMTHRPRELSDKDNAAHTFNRQETRT